jgi:MoaA/NifB/PqqE/SkfB family radical SAM enzyme
MVSLNLAIGPSCFVRCLGCYNHFGNTYRKGGLVGAAELLDFVASAMQTGIDQVTFSGGDPLTHPELLPILKGIFACGLTIKVDTVGTALLADAPKVFFGEGIAPKVRIRDIAPYVHTLGFPVDGASETTCEHFRTGRSRLLEEVLKAVVAAKKEKIRVTINTVATRENIGELSEMLVLISGTGADEWQIFEFQPSGPLGSRNGHHFILEPGVFDDAVAGIKAQTTSSGLRIVSKSRAQREGTYFMVDDAGLAWLPSSSGINRIVVGHIKRDRAAVLERLRAYVAASATRNAA